MKITGIQRFSTNDGPGIRTMVYFAGCGMRCQWCQNPEAQQKKYRLMLEKDRCIGCKACERLCEQGAASFDNEGAPVIDRSRCTSCMKCTEFCFSGARRASIQDISLEKLMDELRKDRSFYETSGGGVTLSGGECVLNTEDCKELLKALKSENIHTAVETAGYYDEKCLDEVIPYIDLFLFDIKMMSPEKHIFYTGVDNTVIKKNFIKAVNMKPAILRIAVIPGVNDGDEFKEIIEFAKVNSPITEVHILPFHQLGDSKYTQLDQDYIMWGRDTENDENIQKCKEYALEAGFAVSVGGYGVKKEG